jgi:hypothetical protein
VPPGRVFDQLRVSEHSPNAKLIARRPKSPDPQGGPQFRHRDRQPLMIDTDLLGISQVVGEALPFWPQGLACSHFPTGVRFDIEPRRWT